MAILAIYGINWEGPYLPFMVANGKDHTCMVVHITCGKSQVSLNLGIPRVKWDIPRATPFFAIRQSRWMEQQKRDWPGRDMSLDEVQYTPTSTPVAQAASPSVPCRLLQTMLYMASAASASIYEQGWAFDEASINVDIIGHSTYHRLRHHCDFFGPCDVTPWEFSHQKWEIQIGNMGKPTHFLQLLWSFPFQPTVLRGDRSRAFPIPVEFSDGREGSECLISIQAVFIWSALWSQSHGPVYLLEPVETLPDVFNGSGAQEATDQLVHTLISPLMPTFYVCDSTAVWACFSREFVEYESTRSYLTTKVDPVDQKNWSCLQSRSRVETDVKDVANKTTLGLYSFRVLVDHVYSVQQIKDIEERPSRRPIICVGNAHCKHPFTEVIAKQEHQTRSHQGNILGASYLRPGCFHDIMGAPGTPTKYCWVLPVYLIGMLGAPSQKLLGDPRFVSSQRELPSLPLREVGSTRRVQLGASRELQKGCWELPECRIVVNLAEEGNAFYATTEAGMGVRGGRMKGAVSQAGGNTFYATAGGTEEGKSAVSQAEGYNVFHSTEGRHRGGEGQNAFYGAESQAGVHGQVWKGCARMYGTGVFQPCSKQALHRPPNPKNSHPGGCDMENNTGSIQPNKRVLPLKKGWVVPCRDITTEGSSHGLGAYLDCNQDGDPFRVVISDIHNHPNWVHKRWKPQARALRIILKNGKQWRNEPENAVFLLDRCQGSCPKMGQWDNPGYFLGPPAEEAVRIILRILIPKIRGTFGKRIRWAACVI
ncbi:hypothetical protein B0H14DRAFT_2560649 [Mycena olivaceomarginata]|nr:hypothetical protein B0H14DRAFT_2560649 [Mycena olivaceomarginata]